MPRSKGWRDRGERSLHGSQIGDVIAEVMRRPEFARGIPIGTLLEAWPDVVGPRLAAESTPISLDQRVLVIAVTSGPWGSQVRFMVDEIRRRADALLGEGSIERVTVVVRPESVGPAGGPPGAPIDHPRGGPRTTPGGPPAGS